MLHKCLWCELEASEVLRENNFDSWKMMYHSMLNENWKKVFWNGKHLHPVLRVNQSMRYDSRITEEYKMNSIPDLVSVFLNSLQEAIVVIQKAKRLYCDNNNNEAIYPEPSMLCNFKLLSLTFTTIRGVGMTILCFRNKETGSETLSNSSMPYMQKND